MMLYNVMLCHIMWSYVSWIGYEGEKKRVREVKGNMATVGVIAVVEITKELWIWKHRETINTKHYH